MVRWLSTVRFKDTIEFQDMIEFQDCEFQIMGKSWIKALYLTIAVSYLLLNAE